MGAYLETPETRKETFEDKNAKLRYCASSMQGWRLNMEDAEITDLTLNNGNNQLFGVFDGHGGFEVSAFVKQHFTRELQQNKNYQSGNYKEALKETFMYMDILMQSEKGQKQIQKIMKDKGSEGQSNAGCTANVVLITPNKIICANAGDSRAVLSQKGQAVALSVDHKPEDEKEYARVKKAGGDVYQGRINGNLNLSRAMGDFEFKSDNKLPPNQQLIIAEPDIVEYDTLKNQPDFIIMGCDGIWEVQSNQEMVTHFAKEIKTKTLKKTVEDFLDSNIATNTQGLHGLDNMTCMIIQFF